MDRPLSKPTHCQLHGTLVTTTGPSLSRHPLLQLLHLLHLVELFFENRSLPIFDNEIWSLRLSCTLCAWKMAGIFSPQKY
jgi:hypothetical protein